MSIYLIVRKTDLGHDWLMKNEVLAHIKRVFKFFLMILIDFVRLKEVVFLKVYFRTYPCWRVHQYLQVLGCPVRSMQPHLLKLPFSAAWKHRGASLSQFLDSNVLFNFLFKNIILMQWDSFCSPEFIML